MLWLAPAAAILAAVVVTIALLTAPERTGNSAPVAAEQAELSTNDG